jgi:hypothetical protein
VIVPRRPRALRGPCTLAAFVASVALAACGSGGGGSTTPGTGHQATGHLMSQTIPAQIDRRPHGFSSADLIKPVVNGWRTSSRRQLTQVDAGALAADRSIGVLAVFRHQFATARQSSDLVKVIGSGPLRITRAPQGHGVEAVAQRTGEIGFVGARGVRGTLHLRDDTISLLPPSGGR